MPVIAPTAAFIDTLRFGTYLVEARMTVYQNGLSTSIIVPISTAQITVDRNSANRRQGSITAEFIPSVPPPANMPTDPTSLLAPFGTEIFLEFGVVTTAAVVDQATQAIITPAVISWTPIGLLDIATTTVDDTTVDLTVTLDVYDRSWVISQRSFLQPYNIPATPSGLFEAEIQQLLNLVWNESNNAPGLIFNIAQTDPPTLVPGASYNQGDDPWDACQDMASACGYELFFDVNGVVTGYPIPDPTTTPITWNFNDDPTVIYGDPGTGSAALFGGVYSTPVECQNQMTRDGISNDFYVAGTGSQTAPGSASGYEVPALARASDTNPRSATYIYGGVGDVPTFTSSNLVLTNAQALAMAQNLLQNSISASWQITVTYPPNPIFDIDDCVTVTRPRMGLNNVKMVIDTITHSVNYADLSQITGRVVAPVTSS